MIDSFVLPEQAVLSEVSGMTQRLEKSGKKKQGRMTLLLKHFP